MAHCPPALLDDVADVLAEVRGWAGVVEKKPGVFYVRREPFLHFHLVEGGQRRGDVKGCAGWIQLDLPRPISVMRRRRFLRELRRRYQEKEGRPGRAAQAGGERVHRRAPGRVGPGRRERNTRAPRS